MALGDSGNPIFDCGKLEPMRTRVFLVEENGRMVTRSERRGRGIGLVMLDSAGNDFFFRTTNAMAEKSERDPYGLQKMAEKTVGNAKWQTDPMVPYLMCPQQTEHQFKLPANLSTGIRCAMAADGQPIGEDRAGNAHPCKCMVALKAERQARNAERETSRDPRTTIMESMLNNTQEQNASLHRLLVKLDEAGALAAVSAKSEPPRGKADR